MDAFEVEARVVRYLKTPPINVENAEEVKRIMRAHGCTIQEKADHCIITFPQVTWKTEIYPRTMQAHYKIVLPDGGEMREKYDPGMKMSLLRIVI